MIWRVLQGIVYLRRGNENFRIWIDRFCNTSRVHSNKIILLILLLYTYVKCFRKMDQDNGLKHKIFMKAM